jgi:energy-coupling factor transport system substrate-specific component
MGAAAMNPADVGRAGRTSLSYLRSHVRDMRASQDYERLLLVLRVAGVSGKAFGGHDIVTRLLRRQRRNGSFDNLTDRTAFGVLALRAAGYSRKSGPVRVAARWLLRTRIRDGGYANAPGGKSDIDDTAGVLQALAAAGRTGTSAQATTRWLMRRQNKDGGFPLFPGGTSNAQSTSYAVLGLIASGRNPRTVTRGGKSPIAFLKSMQARDGSFRYSRQSAQTPVWVTAQTLIALEGHALPLPTAPRRKARTASTAATTTTSTAPSGTSAAPPSTAGGGSGAAADLVSKKTDAAGTSATDVTPTATTAQAPPAAAEPAPAATTPPAAAAKRDDGSGAGWVAALVALVLVGGFLVFRRLTRSAYREYEGS